MPTFDADSEAIDAGDIFMVTLPDKGGSEQRGRRPVVVMSRRKLNWGNTIVAIPFSTNLGRANSEEVKIPVQEIIPDVDNTYPFRDGVARCAQVFTMDKKHLEFKIGKLSQNAVAAVQLGLSYVFDIR